MKQLFPLDVEGQGLKMSGLLWDTSKSQAIAKTLKEHSIQFGYSKDVWLESFLNSPAKQQYRLKAKFIPAAKID